MSDIGLVTITLILSTEAMKRMERMAPGEFSTLVSRLVEENLVGGSTMVPMPIVRGCTVDGGSMFVEKRIGRPPRKIPRLHKSLMIDQDLLDWLATFETNGINMSHAVSSLLRQAKEAGFKPIPDDK